LNCAYHAGRETVGVCVSCGRAICAECKVMLGETLYCNPCADKMFSAGIQVGAEENRSGSGGAAAVSAGLPRWNWGAFLLGWIWALGNRVWIGLIGIAFWAVAFVPSENNATYLTGVVLQVVWSFALGLEGNKWAWRNKRWDSLEHFKRTQRAWAWWGLWVSIALFVIGIILGLAENSGVFSPVA
jgi:hypothetical protein